MTEPSGKTSEENYLLTLSSKKQKKEYNTYKKGRVGNQVHL